MRLVSGITIGVEIDAIHAANWRGEGVLHMCAAVGGGSMVRGPLGSIIGSSTSRPKTIGYQCLTQPHWSNQGYGDFL